MRCPKCNFDLMIGPYGMTLENMLCQNIDCRARWNDTPMGLRLIQIDPHPDEIRKRKQTLDEGIKTKKQECYEHGYDLYFKDVELKDVTLPEGDYTFTDSGSGRLLEFARMGWIQASVDQVKHWLGKENLDKPDPKIPETPPLDYENPTIKG